MDPATISILCTVLAVGISVMSFVRSGSHKSVDDARNEAKEMGRFEAKLDRLIADMETIKAQNNESIKANSRADENFKTLFKWKPVIEDRLSIMERTQAQCVSCRTAKEKSTA